jgi:hypothetical protein
MGGKKSLEREKYSVDVTSSPPDPSQLSPGGWKNSMGSAGNSILQPDSPSPSSSPSSVLLKEDLKEKDSTCLSSLSVQPTFVDKEKDHTTEGTHKNGDKKGDKVGDEYGDENDPEEGNEDQDGGETLDRPLGPSLLGATRSAELNALYHSPPVKGKAIPSVSGVSVSNAYTDNTIFGEFSTIF